MQNQVQVFENKDFGEIRALQIDGQAWFVGKDIADILKYDEPHKAVTRLVDKEDRTKYPVLSQGGKQTTWIINESGLYSLMLSSKLPAARAFKRWVTSEILPSVRKHGAYITGDKLDELLTNPVSVTKLFNLLKAERKKKQALLDYVEAIVPKAFYCDVILKCDNSIPVSVIAKDYGMTAVSFNKLLNGLGVQYSVGGTWVLYKKYSNHGYTITRTYHVNETTADVHTYWTQKGRHFIYEILKFFGVLPEAEKGGNTWLM